MRRHVAVSLFLFVVMVDSKLSKRFKRQTIPSEHIKIHSIDSKVNMDRFINVDSMDCRTQLIEKNVNGTFWSTSSKMQFDAYDSFVNASFNSVYFYIDIAQCELLFGNSLESLLFMTTNRTSDGHSFLTFSLYDNANITLVEEGIEFQGINGRRIYVKSETWTRPVEKTISLGQSDNPIDGEAAVELTIVAPVHMTSVRFVGAQILIKYGPNVVCIDPNFQKVIVYNDKYSYCLDTKSPGSLHVILGNRLITLTDESSNFNVMISYDDAIMNAKQLSKTRIDRGNGPIFISGVPINETGITVNALFITLLLNNNGVLRADCTGSEILMKTSIQNVGLTTEHQQIRITGGVPGFVTESGNIRFEVNKLSDPKKFTYLPVFILPEDHFENTGPYSDNSSDASLVFPNPTRLNYTVLSTDCKGNAINFSISNPETSTSYHLVTFPTAGYPSIDSSTASSEPTTVGHLITLTTEAPIKTELTTNSITELPLTSTSSWSTYISTIELTTQQVVETSKSTDVASSSPTPEERSTQLPIESTEISSSTNSDNITPVSMESSIGIDLQTSTEEGLNNFSATEPSWLTTIDNIPIVTNAITPLTTETTGSSALPGVDVTNPSESSTENSDVLSTSSYGTPYTIFVDYYSTTESQTLDIATQQSTETTVNVIETTSLIHTTETYPLPSQFSTDDFMFGHWFSTEDVRTETTTEVSEIGITASLGNVDFVTVTPTTKGIPVPSDLNINGTSVTPTIILITSTTAEVENSVDGFPNPSVFQLNETTSTAKQKKMLILKLQVPDEVDVNSPDFIRNVTSSLRRLVRDVSTQLTKRLKRSPNAIASDTMQYITAAESNDIQSIPLKVENITKTYNITVITFALQFHSVVHDEEDEFENALHEVDTNNLHRYFAFKPVEPISFVRDIVSDEKIREVLLASFVALLLFFIIVVLYLKKKGVLEKFFRKLDRMKCNALSSHPRAFTPN